MTKRKEKEKELHREREKRRDLMIDKVNFHWYLQQHIFVRWHC